MVFMLILFLASKFSLENKFPTIKTKFYLLNNLVNPKDLLDNNYFVFMCTESFYFPFFC